MNARTSAAALTLRPAASGRVPLGDGDPAEEISTEAFGALVGLSSSTIRHLCREGVLVAAGKGDGVRGAAGAYRLRRGDAAVFVASRKRASASAEVSGEIAGMVFRELTAGKTLRQIVQDRSIDPNIVRALAKEWGELDGARVLVIERPHHERLDRIGFVREADPETFVSRAEVLHHEAEQTLRVRKALESMKRSAKRMLLNAERESAEKIASLKQQLQESESKLEDAEMQAEIAAEDIAASASKLEEAERRATSAEARARDAEELAKEAMEAVARLRFEMGRFQSRVEPVVAQRPVVDHAASPADDALSARSTPDTP